MLDKYDYRLKPQVLNDLNNRAKPGAYAYPLMWFVVAIWAELPTFQPIFFWTNSIVISFFCILRLIQYSAIKKNLKDNVDKLSVHLIISILGNSLHWGLMTAWVVTQPDLQKIHYIIILCTTASTISASCNLSISQEVQRYHSHFSILPGLITAALFTNGEFLITTFLAFIALLYISNTSRTVARDYYNSINNTLIANDRSLLLEKLNKTDSLTKLHNRPYFEESFLKEWEHATQQEKTISLMMIDLDDFKFINDNYGHHFEIFVSLNSLNYYQRILNLNKVLSLVMAVKSLSYYCQI